MQVAQKRLDDATDVTTGAGEAPAEACILESGMDACAAGVKALRAAASYGHWDLYNSLLERSTGSLRDALAGEALVIAAVNGDAAIVTSLLASGADIAGRMAEALARAANNEHRDIVKALVEHHENHVRPKLAEPPVAGNVPPLSVYDAAAETPLAGAEVKVANLKTEDDAADRRYRIATVR